MFGLLMWLMVIGVAVAGGTAAARRAPASAREEVRRAWRELRLRSVGYPLALVMERMRDDMRASVVPSVTKRYVPGHMRFGLHPRDTRRWGDCFGALAGELRDLMLDEIMAQPSLHLSGPELVVELVEDPEAEPGRPTFVARMTVQAVGDGRAEVRTRELGAHDGETIADPDVVRTVHIDEDGPRCTLCLADGPTVALLGEMVLGRGKDADIRVDAVQVSRRHARLTHVDDRVTVVDLDSENGTFVNDQRVTMAMLEPGDHLRFGDVAAELRAA